MSLSLRGWRLLLVPFLVVSALGVIAQPASADNTTVSTDQARLGWDASEPGLAPSQVTASDFGQQFSTAVDGSVYGQPLVVGDTVVVVTEKAIAYGISATTGAVLWSRNFGPAFQSSSVGCGDLAPDLGSTSTPVYDAGSGTVYVTTKIADGSTEREPHWYLQAVSITDGSERPGFPLVLQGTADNDPTVTFDPFVEQQRPGLLLANGIVYAAFGSHCDFAGFRGWVLAANVGGGAPAMQSAWTAEVSNGSGGGIWQSGAGLASDGNDAAGHARVFLTTGNGISPPAGPGSSPPGFLGDSVVRLGLDATGHLAAADFFAPTNAPMLDQTDTDFGAGAPVALPDSFGTSRHPHLMVQDGKDGRVFLLDRDNLGGLGQGPGGGDAALQVVGPYHGVWGHPAVYPGDGGWVYYVENGGPLRAYSGSVTSTGDPALVATGNSVTTFGYTSGSPVVTSSGTTSGSALVWVISSPGGSGLNAQLHAYDAVPTSGTLALRWSAPIGTASKFSMPAAGSGRIFVGTRDGHLLAFGRPAATALTAQPVDFGYVPVGATASATATFTATRTVTVTSATTSTPYGVDTSGLGLPRTLTAGDTLAVPVTIRASSAGAANGTLTLGTSAGQSTVDLHAVATQSGLAATPASLSFGTVPTGTSSVLTVSITNTGTSDETISSGTAPTAPFSSGNLPAAGTVVHPQQTIALSVTYAPTAAGNDTGSLSLASTSGTVTVPLTGSGETGQGVLTVNPTSTDFGSVVLGTSRTLGFDISNTGNIPLTVTLAKAPSGAFTAVNPLSEGVNLNPGDVVHQQVTFTPTTTGAASASYALNADTGQPTQYVTFTGSGVTGTTLPAPTGSSWTRNGSATTAAGDLVLTPAQTNQAGSAFYSSTLPSEGLDARFTAQISAGTGADGLTFTLLDGAQPATSLGAGGGGLGYGGLQKAVAVTLDTYQNGQDPSANFVGIADGVLSTAQDNLHYVAASTNVGALTAGTHDVDVTAYGGHLRVTVDGDVKIDTAVALPATVRPGFTAATGGLTNQHVVRNVAITSPQAPADTAPPSLELTSPTADSVVTGATAVTASATDDDSGVSTVSFALDGNPLGTAVTAAPYQLAWDTTTVPNGRHTLSATATDAAGNRATTKPIMVTVNNPLPIDSSTSVDGRGTLTAQPVSTTSGNEILLALVSADGPGSGGQATTVSGGGLTWSLVKRANGVRGTSEIWQAKAAAPVSGAAIKAKPVKGNYDGSLTVVALSGTAGAGAATAASGKTGSPSANITTTTAGSWVIGVGNDPTSATGRSPQSGQTLVHQWVDTKPGLTFWVQSGSPALPAGSPITVGDTSPTTDAWNLVAAEIRPAP